MQAKRIVQPLFSLARNCGEIFVLAGKAIVLIFKRPYNFRLIENHLYLDGIKSIPVIFLMAVFTGGVLALQSYFGLQRFGAEVFTGSLVGVSLTKELIPVLTGLMLAGRVCASYSAEIGTMVVTEQVDALFTFGVNPVKYLVSPRLVALVIMTPLLTLFGASWAGGWWRRWWSTRIPICSIHNCSWPWKFGMCFPE
jgi:phospholipid/cholesterol/gamma-HCH transport system permease protein